GVAVAPAVVLGRLDQPLHLPLGQVLAGAVFGIGLPVNCTLFVGWGDQFEGRNSRHFPLLWGIYYAFNTPFIHSCKASIGTIRQRYLARSDGHEWAWPPLACVVFSPVRGAVGPYALDPLGVGPKFAGCDGTRTPLAKFL